MPVIPLPKLDPKVRRDVLARHVVHREQDGVVLLQCGCELADDRGVWLCDFHEGYSLGLESSRVDEVGGAA